MDSFVLKSCPRFLDFSHHVRHEFKAIIPHRLLYPSVPFREGTRLSLCRSFRRYPCSSHHFTMRCLRHSLKVRLISVFSESASKRKSIGYSTSVQPTKESTRRFNLLLDRTPMATSEKLTITTLITRSVAASSRVRLRIVVVIVNLLPPLTTGLIPISNATSRPN